uniref:Transcription factor domain-containing protein n=1 Tax=Bionectria ochroleuca TaxID=29856 RepID=A0A8H7MYL2_BIOOC
MPLIRSCGFQTELWRKKGLESATLEAGTAAPPAGNAMCGVTRRGPSGTSSPNGIEASLPDRIKYTRWIGQIWVSVSANDGGILSVNCTHHGRVCEYPSTVPLRERRAKKLPGQQQPFTLGSYQYLDSEMAQEDRIGQKSQWLSVYSLEPVSISMPLRSRELLNYFQQTSEHDLKSLLADQWNHTLSLTINDPDALRNTLLIAGLHYTWRVGDMRRYEQTYLFHKVKTMQHVNGSLTTPNTDSQFMHLVWGISTLCLTEHLQHTAQHQEPHQWQQKAPLPHQTGRRADLPKLISLLKKWNTQGIGSIDMIMKSMLFIPFFQASSNESAFGPIDASSVITSLRMLTTSASALPSLSPEQLANDPGWIWINGAASKLAFALVSSQVNAYPRRQKDDGEEVFLSSWGGIATASELYLDCILGIWNAGEPIECRVLRRMMLFLAQDLQETIQEVGDPTARDLWLWKTMVGACALARYAHRGDGDGTLGMLVATFQSFLLIWSEKTSVVEWADAQSSLAKVAWPVMQHDTQHAGEDVWHEAVQLSRPMQGGPTRHDNAGKGEDAGSIIMLFLSSLL